MSRWNTQQDVGWARVNKNILGEREPARVQSNSGSKPWRTYSRGAARRLPFKYVQRHSCATSRIKGTGHEFNVLLACYNYLTTFTFNAFEVLVNKVVGLLTLKTPIFPSFTPVLHWQDGTVTTENLKRNLYRNILNQITQFFTVVSSRWTVSLNFFLAYRRHRRWIGYATASTVHTILTIKFSAWNSN
jgi:hypothetical protein